MCEVEHKFLPNLVVKNILKNNWSGHDYFSPKQQTKLIKLVVLFLLLVFVFLVYTVSKYFVDLTPCWELGWLGVLMWWQVEIGRKEEGNKGEEEDAAGMRIW